MTPLAAVIARRIRDEGPMSAADYMALALGHPEHGYYITRDPLGAAGDFITAPEISQMFGEMIGLWLAAAWQGMGAPAPVVLAELGPGRGTLMADALRAAARVPGFHEAARVWLVETSPALRQAQGERVPGASWADRLEDVPEGPTLLIANEFLDALPVRQFLATREGWREKLVGLEDGRLAWGLGPSLPGAAAEPGAWREISPAADRLAEAIAARLGRNGGAALLIDYGYTASTRPEGFTLQAVRRHAFADPLADPGEADLTWLVDFDRVAARMAPLRTGLTRQGAFLAGLGIGRRAEALAQARPAAAEAVADALERLTGPDAMGRLFHVLAAWPAGAPAPPLFEEMP